MIEMIQNDPFIPIAWQEQHTGMQGTKYITDPERIQLEIDDWIADRDYAIRKAIGRMNRGITKQIINRPLEAWAWTTELITATEWENFFHLRCPAYEGSVETYRSKKDLMNSLITTEGFTPQDFEHLTTVDWLQRNKGQAEIHMMALAEAMWDARNESTPKELQPGEWHIPYSENFDLHKKSGVGDEVGMATLKQWLDAGGWNEKLVPYEVQLSTAVCAKTSYTVVGTDQSEISPTNLLDLHHSLLVRPYTNRKGVVFGPDDPIHTSPSEHCAQAMTEEEYYGAIKGTGILTVGDGESIEVETIFKPEAELFGWCHNLHGFKSYRSMIPNENRR
jgi:hypothetical protein